MTVRAVERAGARPAPGARMSESKRRDWLTVAEAAERSDISQRRIQELCESGAVIAERATAEDSPRGVWLVYWPSLAGYPKRDYPKRK